MIKSCSKCKELLREGDWIRCEIEAQYKVLKSSITYALYPDSMEVMGQLRHVNCHEGD